MTGPLPFRVMRPAGRAAGTSGRAVASALLSAGLAAVGHGVGSGELPTPTPLIVGVLGVAGMASALAHWSGGRRRRCWEALALLWAGQAAGEALLICESGPLHRPVAALAVHALAGVLVALLLLGGHRVLEDTASAVDSVLSRWWAAGLLLASPHRPSCPTSSRAPYASPVLSGIRVRGPPLPA